MDYFATQIQRMWRGHSYRINNLPNSLKSVKTFLNETKIKCSSETSDGRINSCFDERTCLIILKKNLKRE